MNENVCGRHNFKRKVLKEMFKTKDFIWLFVTFYYYYIFPFKRVSLQEREMCWLWPNHHVSYVFLYRLGRLQIDISYYKAMYKTH